MCSAMIGKDNYEIMQRTKGTYILADSHDQ